MTIQPMRRRCDDESHCTRATLSLAVLGYHQVCNWHRVIPLLDRSLEARKRDRNDVTAADSRAISHQAKFGQNAAGQ
jgi:hypothetical protein